MLSKLKHIVISGGGPLAFYSFGVLRELHKRQLFNINTIQSIHGTSSGSLIAFIVASKLNMDDINDYLLNFPYNKYFSIKFDNMINLTSKQGLFDKHTIDILIDPILKTLNWDNNISLQEMREHTGINLHIYSTELNTFEIVDFNANDTPMISLKDALYASCAHPIMFSPHYIYSDSKFTDACLIDGGLLCNVPLASCMERYCEQDYKTHCNNEILCIHYNKNMPKTVVRENAGFLSYFKTLLLHLVLNSEKYNFKQYLPYIKYNCEIVLNETELDWNKLLNDRDFRANALNEISILKTDELIKKYTSTTTC